MHIYNGIIFLSALWVSFMQFNFNLLILTYPIFKTMFNIYLRTIKIFLYWWAILDKKSSSAYSLADCLPTPFPALNTSNTQSIFYLPPVKEKQSADKIPSVIYRLDIIPWLTKGAVSFFSSNTFFSIKRGSSSNMKNTVAIHMESKVSENINSKLLTKIR